MDVSLGRPLKAVRGTPVLRVVETDHLVLHEDADPARVRRLSDALRHDALLRNPPVGAALADGRVMVLDGANRATALAALGIPHVVVQLVEYGSTDVTLSAWRHYVEEEVDDALRDRARELAEARPAAAADLADAEDRLASGRASALLVDRRGALVLGHGGSVADIARLLQSLVALYRGRIDVHRLDDGDWNACEARYGPGALVVFPPFAKAAILELAVQGGRLPTGITRHLVHGRALRVNTPLEWLGKPGDAAAKQTDLERTLRRRYLEGGVRYYGEATVAFDE